MALGGAVSLFALDRVGAQHHVVDELGSDRVPQVAALGEMTTLANKIRKDQLNSISATPRTARASSRR